MKISTSIDGDNICHEKGTNHRAYSLSLGIEGKKYLVTGASSGIGQTSAIMISKFGGRVILNGRNKERLTKTFSQMNGNGHFVMPFDLEDLANIKDYIETCVNLDGKKFDGMVFSAGIVNPTPIRAERIENLKHMMKINFYSFFEFLREFASKKFLNDGSSIVAVSSGAAISPAKGQLSYACSKISIDTSCEIAAQEFAKRKIRVNTVRPTMTISPMSAYYFEDLSVQKQLENIYPLGALTTADVANSILFLLSDASSKITGQHICISGGEKI